MSSYKNKTIKNALLSFLFGFCLTIFPLNESLNAIRPSWIAMLIIFWALYKPRVWSVGSAWIIGIFLDVSQGTFLGQHALALCCIAFITIRFHLIIRVFPLLQMTATIFPILAIYQFLLFWINGVGGVDSSSISYWGPLISSTVLWPLFIILLKSIRFR